MRVFLLTIMAFAVSFGTVTAQEEEYDNSFFGSLIRSYGISAALTNYVRTAPQFSHTSLILRESGEVYYNNSSNYMSGMNLLGFHYGMRKNLVEMSVNNTISLGVYPAIKLSLVSMNSESVDLVGGEGGFAFGEVNMPVLFEYNHGNVAGWDSDKDKGFVIGAGLDLRYTGLLWMEGYGKDFRNAYVTSLFKFGYRYWSENNNARELSFKVGLGFETDNYASAADDDLTTLFVTNDRGYTLRALTMEFVWCTFFNY
ncbi:MAG: hypothetical protein ACJA0Q_000958 [Saprospiraceae bacterium]|jgi:hypothetical protein